MFYGWYAGNTTAHHQLHQRTFLQAHNVIYYSPPSFWRRPNTDRLRLPRHPREGGDLVDVIAKLDKTNT